MGDCLTEVVYDNEDNVWWLRGEDHILGEEEHEHEEGDEGHGGPGLEGDRGLGPEGHGGPGLEVHGTGPTHTVHHCHHYHKAFFTVS